MTREEAYAAKLGDPVKVERKSTYITAISMRGVHCPYFRVNNGGGSLYSYLMVSKEAPTS